MRHLASNSWAYCDIGIGAGAACDGQILVGQDMLGMVNTVSPRFIRQFAEAGEMVRSAVQEYCRAVKTGIFPAAEHGWDMDTSIISALK